METVDARTARSGFAVVAIAVASLAAGTATGLSRFTPATGILALAGVVCLGLSLTIASRLLPVAIAMLGALIVVAHANGVSVYALPFLVAALPTIADAAALSNRLQGAESIEPRALKLAAHRTLPAGLTGLATATVVLAAAALPITDGALAGIAGACAVALAAYWATRLASRG